MEDIDVIDRFVHRGSRTAFGPTLHIEGDALLIEGWWPAVYRIGPGAFILRGEDPPFDTNVMAEARSVLTAAGLTYVASDLPAVTQITYTSQYSLGYVPWDVWGTDLAAAEAALAVRATDESFIESAGVIGNGAGDFISELGGARRVGGLPPSVILTVGVASSAVEPLESLLTDCYIVSKGMGEIAPDACGALIPTLMLVDGTVEAGRNFMMELRAVACGRTIPVVAVMDEPGVPLGANAAVRLTDEPGQWVSPIRDLLP